MLCCHKLPDITAQISKHMFNIIFTNVTKWYELLSKFIVRTMGYIKLGMVNNYSRT